MFYTYVLQSEKTGKFYIGSTNNLKRRFSEHNAGQSTYTKTARPWVLIYYEAYQALLLARRREQALKKRAKAWQELLKRLEIER